MTINLDRTYCAVVIKTHCGALVFAERSLDEMSLPQTVLDIEKMQIEDVEAVISFNPVEGWSQDVTEVCAEFVAQIINNSFNDRNERPHPSIHDWVTRHCDVAIPAAFDRTFQAAE